MAILLMTSEPQPRRRRRLMVRIYPTKLEGGALSAGATIRVETRLGFRNKQSLLLLSPKREHRRASTERVVGENGGAVEWTTNDGVLEKSYRDQSEFDLSFSVLRKVEVRDVISERWEEIGRLPKVKVKVQELGNRNEMEMEIKKKIRLQGGGGSVLISTLTVVVSIAAVEEGSGGELDSAELRQAGFFKMLSFSNNNKRVGMSPDPGVLRLRRSNSSPINVETTKSLNMLKKKMVSFFTGNMRKAEPVVKKKNKENGKRNCDGRPSEKLIWEVKEIVSRDGEAELKCSLGLASFDQCSKEVAGEGACSVIVALIAYWLHMNKGRMPNRAELDRLMVEGAIEWNKLGMSEAYLGRFPDGHLDIETVVRAGIRPLKIKQESSVVGFFSPHKFALLKGAVCFDGIWSDIVRKAGVYIVSWNDHFCVLKVEGDACYLIDSLGRRLEEGCTVAFILKFDESSVMKRRKARPEGEARSKPNDTSSIPEAEAGGDDSTTATIEEEEEVRVEDDNDNIICRGIECCKEFFKRFLAAIPVKQLEERGEHDIMCSSELHRMLQIEFQYTTT